MPSGARNSTLRARLARPGTAALTAIALAAGTVALSPVTANAGGKFVFANSSAYDTMDPQAVFDVGRVAYRLNLYDGLMRWLDNPPKLTNWLAESYSISDDGKTYTFKLSKGAKFHDGSEIEESYAQLLARSLAVLDSLRARGLEAGGARPDSRGPSHPERRS